MKTRRFLFLSLALLLTITCMTTITEAQNVDVKPPTAKKLNKVTQINGDKLTDDYAWLREKKDAEVIKHLEAENAYADAFMKPTVALQEQLYKEMLGRIKETDDSVPYRLDDYFYYTRTEQGKSYPIYCRKLKALNAKEEVMLDVNKLAEGQKFMSIGNFDVSNDGNLLAYSTDNTGYRQYTLRIRDLRTMKDLPVAIERCDAAMWAADNKTLFYVTEDATTKRSDKMFKHVLGDEPTGKTDKLIKEEKDELYRLFAGRTRDRKMILVGAASSETTEFSYIPTDKTNQVPTLILARKEDHEYYPDHREGQFYIRTNDGAKNFRLVTAPVSNPARENWKEVTPGRAKVKIEDVDTFKDFLVTTERENGLIRFVVTDFKTDKSHAVQFDEPAYAAFQSVNPEYDTTKFRFGYQSMVTPTSIYDYDMRTRERELKKQQEIPSGYDAKLYASERVYATAGDGTQVPISIVYKKSLFKRDGSTPMLLYAYGSYGIPMDATFSTNRLSLLERGVTFAIAHIRGGGDLGEEWHDAGKMMNKKNTFTDFIACAEHLTKEKYTSTDKLAIMGGSAGGLLMGAVVNMRPDLFKVVISLVPFVDVINTMLDTSLPLTVGEYLEWGNPNDKAAYAYMKSYSPYDNIEAKEYPTTLVRTGLNDSQVMYWEPAKYVAKLRAMKKDSNPLVFKINMGAGHGGSSGRYDALRETAFDYAFILTQLGVVKTDDASNKSAKSED